MALNGMIYNCHMRPKPLGMIEDLEHISTLGLTNWSENDYCIKCPYIQACGGACPSQSPEEHRFSCNNFYPLAEGIFKGALTALFGVYVKSIRSV